MTFDFKIQKCKHCGKEYLTERITSGNTFGMRMRSDGKRIDGNMLESKVVFKCDNCSELNWINSDGTEIGERRFEELSFIPEISIELCEEIISDKLYYDLKTETYIRIKYWHLCNDKNNKEQFKLDKNNKILISNLNILLEIFKKDSSNIDKQLLRCEILRELGLFKEAKNVLLEIKELNNNYVVSIFEKLIDSKNDNVQIIF